MEGVAWEYLSDIEKAQLKHLGLIEEDKEDEQQNEDS